MDWIKKLKILILYKDDFVNDLKEIKDLNTQEYAVWQRMFKRLEE
jgi:hypothetical protein